ncbi:MAG: hypothetical protein ABIT83_10675 [Massilia sp.]
MPLYHRSPLYFSLLLLIALAGFYPSFYSRALESKGLHQFHGAVSTAWILLLISQGWLMRRRKLAVHRTAGKLSLIIVPLFAVSGLMIVHDMLTRDSGFARAFGPRLAFIDLSSIAFFVFAYGAAIYHRHELALHARFMAATALPLLPPALSRLLGNSVPAVDSFGMALHLSFVATELVVAALLMHDRKESGKMRAPYLILLVLLLVQQASFELSMRIGGWADVVAWIQTL